MKIQEVITKDQADRVSEFFLTKGVFNTTFTETEIEMIKNTPFESISEENAIYYFIEENEKVVAAGGIKENEIGSLGFYLNFFAVHFDHHRKGYGSAIMKKIEEFVASKKGRYITIDTGDNERFEAARKFYESHGYQKVGLIPDYYYDGEGRVDYYKRITEKVKGKK